jgi:hypothetical protein
LEVVQHPVIPVEELSRSSFRVHRLAEDLSVEVSEALGISLSEVCDQYFGGSDKVKRDRVLEERDRYQDRQRFKEEQKRADE